MSYRFFTALSVLLLAACSDTPETPQKVVADGVGSGATDTSGAASGSSSPGASGTTSNTATSNTATSNTATSGGTQTGSAGTATNTSGAGTGTAAADDTAGDSTPSNGAGLGGTPDDAATDDSAMDDSVIDDSAIDDSAGGSGDDSSVDDSAADDSSVDDTDTDDGSFDDSSADDMGTGGLMMCGFGAQSGSPCNPAFNTQPCTQGGDTCECGADSTWSCGSEVGGTDDGAADDSSMDDSSTDDSSADDSSADDSSTDDSAGGGTVEIDCDAQMPMVATEQHSATWAVGGSGNLAWEIWTNGSPGNLTTYAGEPAFSASWNNSGNYLGRMGLEWGNNGRPYTEYGTIKADYVWNKSGNAGQYSYLGIYGWSTNPCVEWYIVEDSFHPMPFNTGDQPIGTAEVDGGTYNLVYRHTSGTGGDRCGGASSWDQFYSIRLEGKRCGTITVSDHFDVWAQQGWNLGNMLEVKIVVEAAAGTGSVDFPLANVTTSQ